MSEEGTTVWHLGREVQKLWEIIDKDPSILMGDRDELNAVYLSLKALVATLDARRVA